MPRTRTPDVMGEVLDGTAKPQADKPAKAQDAEPPKQQDDEPPKVRVTHYLRPEVANALEVAVLELRRLPGATRGEINKSEVIEAALQIVMHELQEHGAKSRLARMMLSGLDDK